MKASPGFSKLSVLLLLLMPFSSYSQQMLLIDSCQQAARQNYPLIRQYELIDKSTEYTISNANKAYLPQVSLTGIGAYVFGGFPNLGPPNSGSGNDNVKFIGLGQINQVLWDGGATGTQKDIAKALAGVEKANVDVQLYALKERINQLYFGILLIDEQLKQLDIQIGTFDRNVKRLQLLNKSGLALKTDLSELQAEVLKVRQRKTEFEFSRKSYLYMLSLFMGRELSPAVVLQIPEVVLGEQGQNKRPELALYESQRSLLHEQSSIDKVKLMPKVGLLGAGVLITPGINLGLEEKSSFALAGLSVSWEINGLYTHSGSKQLRQVNLKKVDLQQETFLFNNMIQSNQTTAEIEKYKALEQSDDEIISLRTSIRENYQLQYENGSCSLLQLVNATEKETEAASGKAMHHIQQLLSIYQLKTNTGN